MAKSTSPTASGIRWLVLVLALPAAVASTRFNSYVTPFGRDSVIAAIQALKEGKPIVVTDDEDRENEGDLIIAGGLATADTVGFIVRHSSGVICVSVPGERLEALELPPMCVNNEDPKGTAFTVSVDAKSTSSSTGISAADRAAAMDESVEYDYDVTFTNDDGTEVSSELR